MKSRTLYCTVEQTERLYRLNAPLEHCSESTYMQMGVWYTSGSRVLYEAPDHQKYYLPASEQVIDWLDDTYGLFVSVCKFADETYYYTLYYRGGYVCKRNKSADRRKSYMEAIDDALQFIEGMIATTNDSTQGTSDTNRPSDAKNYGLAPIGLNGQNSSLETKSGVLDHVDENGIKSLPVGIANFVDDHLYGII